MALLLAAVIFGLLLFENHQYLFATRLYENTDVASDSLLVREAKHTFLLHGHYSQWRFYHPGPALIDTLALGEWVFFDRLHLVPTPLNGQLIALCLVMTLFFALALTIFARRLGSSRGGHLFFLPLALLFAVWHYGAVGGKVFLDAWPAYPPIMALLCFLVAVAGTAAGDGWQLPVLVAAGGWLVHNHAAQPLFVVPLTLLGYAGLLGTCRRETGDGDAARPGIVRTLGVGWRVFPRAHGVATALLALFVLPLFLDALRGGDSNLARMLSYLHTRQDAGRKLVTSFCYFLTFGGYDTYLPGGYEPGHENASGILPSFGHYTPSGMLAFVGRHWCAYAYWLVALLGTPALFWSIRQHRSTPSPDEKKSRPEHFLRWFYGVLAASWVLTLIWGVRQDRPMFYYNAYFNYSIFFGLALGLAAALAMAMMAWTASPTARRARPIISAFLWLGVAASLVSRADRFRVDAFASPADIAMAGTVERAAGTLPPGALCFVDCRPWENWRAAIAVVLELERLGRDVRVNDNWEILFGNLQTVQHAKIDVATPLARWMVVSRDNATARLPQWPLEFGCALDVKALPGLDPAGQHIGFSRAGNFEDFAFYGWSPTELDWTWSDQRNALIVFRPLPLPKDAVGVDLLITVWAFAPPGKPTLQPTVIQFDGAVVATLDLPLLAPGEKALRVRIDAARWQRAVSKNEARLQFLFPDAKSPASLGLGADYRRLGGGFRAIDFLPVFSGGSGADWSAAAAGTPSP